MNKANKIIAAGLAATAIVTLSFGSVYAMGNGQGSGQGDLGTVITAEEKAKLQSMDKTEKQAYSQELKEKYNITKRQTNGNKNTGKHKTPADVLVTIEKQELDATEINLLQKQFEEETMAQELYSSFYDMYGLEIFKKVAASEVKHLNSVKALFDRYELEYPTEYDHLKELYEELKESGSKSVFDALEVGVKIEFVDIEDIVTAIKSTDNEDIKVILTNIGGASYNHLRGFVKAIDSEGYETELDWEKYLDESDLSVKGPVKYKLAERLESEGVKLPEQVSYTTMKQKSDQKMQKKAEMQAKVTEYKKVIKDKYGAKINSISNENLEKVILKVDDLITKTKNNTDYSQATKEKFVYTLMAFKEVILEKIAESELNIEELLK